MRALIPILLTLAAVARPNCLPSPPQSPGRAPAAVRADAAFFSALNRDPSQRAVAIAALGEAALAAPRDGLVALHMGLAHLWCAAERRDDALPVRDRLILAIHELRRAASLRPDDDRIPSWLLAATASLARLESDPAADAAAVEALAAHAATDPCFHAVALAILSFEHPADSPAFRRALTAMQAAAACPPDRPATTNQPRWPHNLEGFSIALAEMQIKAGDRAGAERMLLSILSRPSAQHWPFRTLADDRLDRLAGLSRDAAAGRATPFVLHATSGVSCSICHQQGQ